MVIKNLEDAREAIRKATDSNPLSITALSEVAGIARGSMTRFMNSQKRVHQLKNPDIYLGTYLDYLSATGYEVVVRRRERPSRRQQARENRGGNQNG